MPATLLDITDDMQALDALLMEAGGDTTGIEDTVANWFKELGEARAAKLDNYAALIRDMELRAIAHQAEIDRHAAHVRTLTNSAKFLKERLKSHLEATNTPKIKCNRFTLSIAGNGGKLPLILHDPNVRAAELPPAYQRFSVDIDKEAIRADLEAGKVLPFAALGERGTRLSIR
jgi:hypothetical protein